ncbi:hypothetical protein JW877_10485 [bacterium]|nr:hypothetical protein [bacterium]
MNNAIRNFLTFLILFCFIAAAYPANFYNGINTSGFSGFELNRGQIYDEDGQGRPEVQFVAGFPGVNLFFTPQGVVLYFRQVEASKLDLIMSGKMQNPYSAGEWERIMSQIAEGNLEKEMVRAKTNLYRVDLCFPGADLSHAGGEFEKQEKRHYYHPNYPEGIRDVILYERIRYKNIYAGIDLVFRIHNGVLKYDFEVASGADPDQIRIAYKGYDKMEQDKQGNINVHILPGIITEQKPACFQEGGQIPSEYVLSNDTIQFRLQDYDHEKPLIIDPSLVWSTYFHDGTTSAAFTYTRPVWDSEENMFMVFDTYNRTVFPTINPGGGAYYQSTAGSTGLQLVIQKFNTSRQIVWATYYASSQAASTNFTNQGLVIDQSNNIYIVGHVFYVYADPPASFPLYNPGGAAYYESAQGNNRNFILKFSSSGVRLWATMFCTSGASSSGLDLEGLAIDNNNKLVIVGQAYTPPSWTSMPVANPGGSHYYKTSPAESRVPTLHRFSTSLGLEWSTYISQGTSGTYCGNVNSTVDIDGSNNIFAASDAHSSYTTVNPGGGAYIDGTGVSGRKISIYKFLSSGALNWCTLYGGSLSANSVLWQDIRDLKVASNGDVFLAGRVNTTNFPTYNPGGGAYVKTTLSTGSSWVCDGVILQFSNGGVRKWATYCGGNGTSDGTDFMGLGLNSMDDIYIAGISRSSAFPVMSKTGSYNQSSITGDYAIVLAQFNVNGVMQWASYFGDVTFMSSGGFAAQAGMCGSSTLMLMGTANNSYSLTTVDPGGGAYYNASIESGGSLTDFYAEFSEGASGYGGPPGIWTWLGYSNDWFDPCNWDKMSVPTLTSDVQIPGGTAYYPLIDDEAECKSIEIATTAGAEITIDVSSGGNLEVAD